MYFFLLGLAKFSLGRSLATARRQAHSKAPLKRIPFPVLLVFQTSARSRMMRLEMALPVWWCLLIHCGHTVCWGFMYFFLLGLKKFSLGPSLATARRQAHSKAPLKRIPFPVLLVFQTSARSRMMRLEMALPVWWYLLERHYVKQSSWCTRRFIP